MFTGLIVNIKSEITSSDEVTTMPLTNNLVGYWIIWIYRYIYSKLEQFKNTK